MWTHSPRPGRYTRYEADVASRTFVVELAGPARWQLWMDGQFVGTYVDKPGGDALRRIAHGARY